MKTVGIYLVYIGVCSLAGMALAALTLAILVSSNNLTSDWHFLLGIAVWATILVAGPIVGFMLAFARTKRRRPPPGSYDANNPYPPAG